MIQKMLDRDYFAIDAISNSLLSRFERCPANTILPMDETPNMLLGSAAHCAILEGKDEFMRRFSVSPKCDKRTNEGKRVYAEFVSQNEGKIIISEDQFEAVMGMAESVASHPSVGELLGNGQAEMAFTWTNKGADLKGKADWISSTHLIDLKTCQNSSYEMFSRTIINSGYYRQMAMYLEGLRENYVHVSNAIIIAVENTAPYTCEVYRLDDELLEYGLANYHSLLDRYIACKNADYFPSFRNAGILDVRPPAWMTINA